MRLNKFFNTYKTTSHENLFKLFSTILRSQGKDIVSDTKAIIETHISYRCYQNYSNRIFKNTTIIVLCTTEKMSNLTVTLMNCLKAVFH